MKRFMFTVLSAIVEEYGGRWEDKTGCCKYFPFGPFTLDIVHYDEVVFRVGKPGRYRTIFRLADPSSMDARIFG